jgi:GT2 family glycosyltransferase
MQPQVTVVIVTFNSLPYIEACLRSLERQSYLAMKIVVIDNASYDGTADFLRDRLLERAIFNRRNVGFAAAQNQGIRMSKQGWVLTLNPDVVLDPDFISNLVDAAEGNSEVGTACGKLLRWQPDAAEPFSNVIDSTGIYFRPDLRHLDRGAEEIDGGQYDRREYVFGATGAAALYRREMITDVSVESEFFDEDFFSYREDADIAWRAQLMGWKCLYVPEARGWHVRRVTPERRNELPQEINWHSVKNRFMMRMKNAGAGLWVNFVPQIIDRDLTIVGYSLLADRNLLSALFYPLKTWRAVVRKRRIVQSRRRVRDRDLMRWFDYRPHSEPVAASENQRRQKAS